MAYKMKNLEKKARGRPKKIIDEEMLFKLAQTMLPIENIATILDCNPDTIYRNYSEVLHRGRENRKSSLSQAMWHKALVEKDCKMQIWLSKQYLGHRELQPDEAPINSFNIQINEIPS